MTQAPMVFVVDDDPSVRSSLKFLIGSVGLQVESFDSAEGLLRRKLPDEPSRMMISKMAKQKYPEIVTICCHFDVAHTAICFSSRS